MPGGPDEALDVSRGSSHFGDAALYSGSTLYGAEALTRRHRRPHRGSIAAVANGGEILVSSTVRDLVAGSGISFDDRGTHELKGVPEEWRLYPVTSL